MKAKPKPSRAKPSDNKIDEEIEESFPASDPPAFTGAARRIGAPRKPKSPLPKSTKKRSRKRA